MKKKWKAKINKKWKAEKKKNKIINWVLKNSFQFTGNKKVGVEQDCHFILIMDVLFKYQIRKRADEIKFHKKVDFF